MSKGSHRRRAQRADAAVSSFHTEEESHAAGHHHARLEHTIHEELVGLLRDELGDRALDGVAFTAVELSEDYRSARVRFAVDDARRAHSAQLALERASTFLRASLVDALAVKRVPSLRFVLDPDAPIARAVPDEEDPS